MNFQYFASCRMTKVPFRNIFEILPQKLDCLPKFSIVLRVDRETMLGCFAATLSLRLDRCSWLLLKFAAELRRYACRLGFDCVAYFSNSGVLCANIGTVELRYIGLGLGLGFQVFFLSLTSLTFSTVPHIFHRQIFTDFGLKKNPTLEL